jgi:hypothetical protein
MRKLRKNLSPYKLMISISLISKKLKKPLLPLQLVMQLNGLILVSMALSHLHWVKCFSRMLHPAYK